MPCDFYRAVCATHRPFITGRPADGVLLDAVLLDAVLFDAVLFDAVLFDAVLFDAVLFDAGSAAASGSRRIRAMKPRSAATVNG